MERIWLINQTPNEILQKAIKYANNIKWKENYVKFVKKVLKENWNIWIDIRWNAVYISPRWTKWRWLLNPKYKKWWFLKPANIPLVQNVLDKLLYNQFINKRNWNFNKLFTNSKYATDQNLFEQMLLEMEDYLKTKLNKNKVIYLYKLHPDIIWVIHSIITKLYKEWTITYNFDKSIGKKCLTKVSV